MGEIIASIIGWAVAIAFILGFFVFVDFSCAIASNREPLLLELWWWILEKLEKKKDD